MIDMGPHKPMFRKLYDFLEKHGGARTDAEFLSAAMDMEQFKPGLEARLAAVICEWIDERARTGD